MPVALILDLRLGIEQPSIRCDVAGFHKPSVIVHEHRISAHLRRTVNDDARGFIVALAAECDDQLLHSPLSSSPLIASRTACSLVIFARHPRSDSFLTLIRNDGTSPGQPPAPPVYLNSGETPIISQIISACRVTLIASAAPMLCTDT